MQTDRKFADFGKNLPYYCMDTIPPGGLCLSAFLVLSRGNENNVLLGKVNPKYTEWAHIAALDETRLQRFSTAWMLPSRHLILHEDPNRAAKTILKEQLDIEDLELTGPKVVTEVYDIPRLELKDHWDFDFIFFGKITRDLAPHAAWTELNFIDVSSLPDNEFARGHQDVLANAGLRRRQTS